MENLLDDDYDLEISDFEPLISSLVLKVFLMSFNKSQRNWTFILGQNDLGGSTIILGQKYPVIRTIILGWRE